MKILSLRSLLIFFVSLLFCKEDEKYSLIFGERVIGEKHVYTRSEEISFTLPGIGYVQYVSSTTSILEYLGHEGEFWKFRATLTDVAINNIVSGIEILDQYQEAMENNSCFLYVKSSGFDDEVHHIEPVNEEDDYLQEAFEAAYMNVMPNHFRYPFGSGAVDVAKGDSWNHNSDSVKFYVNMGSPPSMGSFNATLTLKKVKTKKDRKIVIINVIDDIDLNLNLVVNYLGERKFITGHATGKSDGRYQWDIENAEFLKQKLVVNVAGDFEIDGEKVFMKAFMRIISKKVK